MKKGDVLNGYRVETDPTNAGGGMSQWAFGSKDGEEVFIKMFLAPKFPLPDGPGSEASKARKRDACLAFERRHLEIGNRLDSDKPGAGNLVIPRDFFRVGATYVKVMPRVRATELPDARSLTGFQILVLLRTLAFSLRMLHEQNVVHGDIKLDNVLVQRNDGDLYVSKLIDFDEAYVAHDPPSPEHIVGDPSYYPPELFRYIKGDETLGVDALGTASDIFSLGLLLHQFLTGELPGFDRSRVNYPSEALLSGAPIDLSGLPLAIQPLVGRMLSIDPARRPGVQEFIDFLADADPERLAPGSPAAALPMPAPPPAAAVTAAPGPPARPPSAPGPTSRPPVGGASPRPGPEPGRPPDKPESTGLRSTMGRRRRPTEE